MMRRHVLHYILGFLGTAPVLAVAGGAGAGGDRAVRVVCKGAGDPSLHGALCAQLLAGLAQWHPQHDFRVTDSTEPVAPGALTLALTLEKATKTTLIGRLSWSGRATGHGPDVTSGTQDATLGPRQHKMFAMALLKVTPLPL